ncbi:MAG: hypothetical protein ACRCZ2_06850 [Fusobacteriaceae bacterium]
MARIMQVIDKKTDFSKGTVDLNLYQTGFKTLTKTISSVPGQTVDNAAAGQNVGYQFFHNLNDKQLAVRSYLDVFKNKYQNQINSFKGWGIDLFNFSYNFTSCIDYKSQIKAGDKADYKLLQKIVNAEKELYDYRLYASDHIRKNCSIMAEWSKTRKYGSTTKWIDTDTMEMKHDSESSWHFYSSYNGLSCEIHGSGDKAFLRIFGLEQLPLGEKGWVQIEYKNYRNGGAFMKWDVWKHKLGTGIDDGYFTKPDLTYTNGNGYDKLRPDIHAGGQYGNNGKTSPHFTDSTNKYDFAFFKGRVIK